MIHFTHWVDHHLFTWGLGAGSALYLAVILLALFL